MPKRNQLHVSQLLSNVSVKYRNEEYIWDRLFPQVPVKKDTDLYRVYDRNFKIPETKRAPKAVANEFSFEFSTASYMLNQDALKDYVGVDEEENNDQDSLEIEATENLTDAIYRRIEFASASLFTTTNWSLNVSLASGSQFSSNTTTTDPIPVYDTATGTIIGNSGKKPNCGFIAHAGFVAIKNHVSVLDRVKYTSMEVSEKIISGLIGIPEFYVATAIYDSAAQGIAPSMVNFYADKSFIGWKPKSPGRKVPSFAYMFMRSMPRTRKWYDDERNAIAIEVEVKSQAKVVASLTGFLINDVE